MQLEDGYTSSPLISNFTELLDDSQASFSSMFFKVKFGCYEHLFFHFSPVFLVVIIFSFLANKSLLHLLHYQHSSHISRFLLLLGSYRDFHTNQLKVLSVAIVLFPLDFLYTLILFHTKRGTLPSKAYSQGNVNTSYNLANILVLYSQYVDDSRAEMNSLLAIPICRGGRSLSLVVFYNLVRNVSA